MIEDGKVLTNAHNLRGDEVTVLVPGRDLLTAGGRPSLQAFEAEWKSYTQSAFVKAHYNGTSALTSMYFALDLPAGSEIMVPSYTFVATSLAVRERWQARRIYNA